MPSWNRRIAPHGEWAGDRSGDNFETLLARTGLTRDDVFITNAALCNPLHNGNNSRPTAKELRN